MASLKGIKAVQAARITHVLTDVDGVLTERDGGVSICELISEKGIRTFTEVNGDLVRAFRPCRLDGTPEDNELRYIAGKVGDKVFELYRFHIPDGQAVKDLVLYGLKVQLISGRNSPAVRARAHALGAESLLGVDEKHKWLKKQPWFSLKSTLVVSDNNVDAGLLRAVREAGGIAIAPADAESEALEAAEYVTEATGGRGVIAEIAKALLSARG